MEGYDLKPLEATPSFSVSNSIYLAHFLKGEPDGTHLFEEESAALAHMHESLEDHIVANLKETLKIKMINEQGFVIARGFASAEEPEVFGGIVYRALLIVDQGDGPEAIWACTDSTKALSTVFNLLDDMKFSTVVEQTRAKYAGKETLMVDQIITEARASYKEENRGERLTHLLVNVLALMANSFEEEAVEQYTESPEFKVRPY